MAVNLGSVIASLELDTSKYTTALKTAQSQMNQFSDTTATSMQKISGIGAGLTTIGSTLTKTVTLPLLAVGAASVKVGMDFQAAMSEVSAISGATGSDLEMLEEIARKMGQNTVFSATESAEALKYMALAGWGTVEMAEGLEPVLMLAGAANMDLANASNIVTDVLSMFNMEVSEAAHLTDVFAQAQASSNTSVEELAEGLKYVGPAANAMGYSVESTSAALGLLADNAIKGSSGGTALNAMLRDMKKNSDDGAIAIGNTSIAITDANGNYRELYEIVGDIETATEGMTVAQKDAAITAVFGTEAQRAMNILLSEGSENLRELTGDLSTAEGAAAKMYEVMNDNLKGALASFKSSLEAAGIAIFKSLEPALEAVVKSLTKLIDGFIALPAPVQGFITIVGAILIVLGPTLMLLGSFLTSLVKIHSAMILISNAGGFLAYLGQMGGVFKGVSAVGGVLVGVIKGLGIAALGAAKSFAVMLVPLLPYVAIIAAIIAAGYLLIKNWDSISEAAGKLASWLGDSFNNIKDTVNSAWEDIKEKTSEAWSSIKQTVEENGGGLPGVLRTVMENMHWVWFPGLSLLDQLTGGHIKEMATNMIDNLKELPSRFRQAASDTIDGFIEGLKEKMMTPINLVKEFGSNILDSFKEVLQIHSPSRKFKEFARFIVDGFTIGLLENRAEAARMSTDLAKDTVTSFADEIDNQNPNRIGNDLTLGIAEGVVEKTDELASNMEGVGKEAIKAFTDSLKEALEATKDFSATSVLEEELTEAIPALEKAGEKVGKTTSQAVGEGFSEGLLETFEELDSFWDGHLFGNALPISYSEVYKDMYGLGEKAAEGIEDGLEDGKDGIVDTAEEIAEGITEAIEDGVKKINNLGGAIENALKEMYKSMEEADVAYINDKIQRAEENQKSTIERMRANAKAQEDAIREKIKRIDESAKIEIKFIDDSIKHSQRESQEKIKEIQKVRDAKIKALDQQRRAEKRASDERVKELQKLEKTETRVINRRIEAINRAVKAEIEALDRAARVEQTALQDRIREIKRASSEQIDNIRATERIEVESLNRRVEAVRKATAERIREYDREYNEQLKVIDREMYDQINAVQKQINAIDETTKREQFALDIQAHNTRVAELQKKIAVAKSTEERMRLTRELNDTIAAWERRMLLDSREREKNALRDKIDAIRSSFEARKEMLKEEVEQKKEAEQEKLDATVQALQEEIETIKEAANVKAAEEERKREALEETLNAQIEQNKLMLEDAKKVAEQKAQAATDALRQELEEYKDSISDKIEAEKQRLDALEENINREIDAINQVAEHERETEEKRQQTYKDSLDAQKEAINERVKLQKEAHLAEIDRINEQRDRWIQDYEFKTRLLIDSHKDELKATRAHYADLLQADNLRHETAKMLQRGNSDEIMKLLAEYNPKWQSQGQDYASMLSEGIRSELIPMMEDIEEALDIDLTALQETLVELNDGMGETTDSADELTKAMSDAEKAAEGLGGQTSLTGNDLEAMGGGTRSASGEITKFGDNATEHIGIIEVFGKAIGNVFDWLKGDVEASASGMSDSVDKAMDSSGKSFEGLETTAKNSLGNVVTETNKTPSLLATSGQTMGARLVAGFALAQARMVTTASNLARATTNGLRNIPNQMAGIGRNFGQSLAQGIRSQISVVAAAARRLAAAANTGVRERLKINSPSRVGIENGEFFGQGLGLGMLNSIKNVKRNAMTLAHDAVSTMNNALISSNVDLNASASSRANNSAVASSNTTNETTVNLHVGTLVADEQGLKQLERKLRSIRLVENNRFGGAH